MPLLDFLGLTEDQLMGIGSGLAGFGQGMQQGGISNGFAGANQGLLNFSNMQQQRQLMELRRRQMAMAEAQAQREQAKFDTDQRTRDAYRTMVMGGPVSTGNMMGDQVAIEPGLLGSVSSPTMRGLLQADPEKFGGLLAQTELTMDAEKRKQAAAQQQKLWEMQNVTIPTEERKSQLTKDQAAYQNSLALNREKELIPLRASTQADNRRPITLRMQDGVMRSFMPGDPQVRAALDAGAVPVNLSVQSPTIEGMGIGKTGQNQLDEDLIKATDGLARISQVRQTFRPEFQTIETRLGVQWSSLKEKANIPGWQPTPEQKALLAEYTAFARDAWENANATIQSITGAAMTNAEIPRLMRQMPNPGTGLFDGDSPTEFMSKLAGVEKTLRLAFARKSYAKKQGLTWQSIPLENVPKLMAERENQLVATMKMKRPDLDPESPEFMATVKRELATEFGLPVQ